MEERQILNYSGHSFNQIPELEKFSDLIEIDEEKIVFKNLDIQNTSNIIIDLRFLKHEHLIFDNCQFLNYKNNLCSLQINRGHQIHIELIDCSLDSLITNSQIHFSIINSELNTLNLSRCTILAFARNTISNYHLQSCSFKALIGISGNDIEIFEMFDCSTENKILLNKGCKIKSVIISKLNGSKKGKLGFNEVQVDKINLNDVKELELSISRCSVEESEIVNCDFSKASFYDYSGYLEIEKTRIKSGKASLCKGEIYFTNNPIVDFEFKKNKTDQITIVGLGVMGLKIKENEGNISFHNLTGQYFPDIEGNRFEEIIVQDSSFENFLLKGGELSQSIIKLKKTEIENLTVSLASLNQFVFEEGANIGHAQINIMQLNYFETGKCNFRQLELLGQFNEVDVQSTFESLLFTSLKSDHLTLKNTKAKQIILTDVESADLNVRSLEFEAFIIQGKMTNTRIGFGRNEGIEVDWKIDPGYKGKFIFKSASIQSVNINQLREPLHFNLEDQTHIDELVLEKNFINTLDSSNSNYQSVIIAGNEERPIKVKGTYKFSLDTFNLLKCQANIDSLNIDQCRIDSIEIENSFISSYEVVNCSGVGKSTPIKTFKIGHSEISHFELKETQIDQLAITSFSPQRFVLDKLDINTFRLDHFTNNDQKARKEISFINTDRRTESESFIIHNSNLGKLEFNSCYFDSYKKLDVKSSKLDNINCTATTWPRKVVSTKSNGKSEPFEVREACRQLKLAMAAHQDRVSELQFHALEMNAYRKIVITKKPRNWNDILSLFGGWTNQFGLNWMLPSVIIILFNFSWYSLSMWIHFEGPFDWGWGEFFLMFNPVHNTKDIFLSEFSGWVALMDFFGKIVNAFFLFQIVVAFRKYRK